MEFPCANTVFVPVVAVHGDNVAVRIGVVLPSAAIIDNIVDTSELIFATDSQPYSIVLALLCGGDIDSSQ